MRDEVCKGTSPSGHRLARLRRIAIERRRAIERVADVGADMRRIMQLNCGVFRFPDLLADGVKKMKEVAERAGCRLLQHIKMPKAHPFTTPLLYAVPMQMLAYHTAVFMGTDVDQPRNLAKSVTVE